MRAVEDMNNYAYKQFFFLVNCPSSIFLLAQLYTSKCHMGIC